jgi:hypothetical protein
MSYFYWPFFTREHLRLLRKEARLLCRYAAEWEAGLPPWSRRPHQMSWRRFRRGFVATAGADMNHLLGPGNALWKRHPIEALEIAGVSGRNRRNLQTFRPFE